MCADCEAWLEREIRVSWRAWMDSDDGMPEGGSGPGLVYTEDDMEAAYFAGYYQREAEE
jgi:hypothetical protein